MILCCGEALIDMIPVTKDGVTAYIPHTGGAIFNTAIALGRLQTDVGLISGISKDGFGETLATELAADGVSTDFLVRSDRLTTLAVVTLKDGKASYTFYDENSAGRMITPSVLPELTDDISTLYFGGLSLVADPAGATYSELLKREAQRRVIMLDPNIRPGFVDDEPAYRRRLDGLISHCDIVKVSDEDLTWIDGAGDLGTMADRLLSKGAKIVVLTRGAAGATCFTATHQFDVAAPQVDVVDTVGAGDAFNAGFLVALEKAQSLSKRGLAKVPLETLKEAADYAVQVAAITVSRQGANPPYLNEM